MATKFVAYTHRHLAYTILKGQLKRRLITIGGSVTMAGLFFDVWPFAMIKKPNNVTNLPKVGSIICQKVLVEK